MPLFFFDYHDDDGGLDEDKDGLEFPNMEAAYIDAFHSAIDMWVEAKHQGRNLTQHRFIVTDAEGRMLFELPFAEVLG
jgi:hypothetical protein